MDNDRYISPIKIKEKYDISSNTLRLWAETGKIKYIRVNKTGKRIYSVEDLRRIFGENQNISDNRKTICYARVSSNHQKEDLNRQIEFLQNSYPDTEVIKDIGSGLNYKRKGLETLLEQIYTGKVKEVVVTYKDRLCRFGFEIIEWIFKKYNVKLMVLNKLTEVPEDISRESELAEDLLSVTTFFVARNNGRRSAIYKENRKKEKKKEIEEEK